MIERGDFWQGEDSDLEARLSRYTDEQENPGDYDDWQIIHEFLIRKLPPKQRGNYADVADAAKAAYELIFQFDKGAIKIESPLDDFIWSTASMTYDYTLMGVANMLGCDVEGLRDAMENHEIVGLHEGDSLKVQGNREDIVKFKAVLVRNLEQKNADKDT